MNFAKKTMMLIVGFSAVIIPARAVTGDEIAKMRQAMPDKPVVQPERPRRMLVFNLSQGFKHSSIPYWAKALEIMAETTGAFSVEHSEDLAVFAPEALSRFDAVCFNNTTELKLTDDQKEALLAFIKSGKGIVGIHAATDNFKDWPEGMHMMGGVFQGHPWTAGGTWAIKLDDPEHPLLKPFGGKGFKVNDEIYRTNLPYYSRDKQRVLMSLDMSDPATRNANGVTPEDMDTGITWIKPYGQGRLFYCSLGHNHHLTWTTPILEHYLAGIQYALGDLEVDDTPLGQPAPELDVAAVRSLVEKIKAYDWDKSRADLTALQRIIRQYSAFDDQLVRIEQLMQPLLAKDASRAVKDVACRELSVIGTDISLPALAALLDDPETEHMARYALERIQGQKAEAALLDKLLQTSDTGTKIGLISSLGVRRSGPAVGPIARLAADSHADTARAAIQALGLIGTSEAAAALRNLHSSLASDRRLPVLDAMAVCANHLVKGGKTDEALSLYKILYADDNPALIRVAGLTGIAQTSPDSLSRLLPAAIIQDDAVLQAGAIRLLAQAQDTALIEAAVSAMSELSDTAKVSLLAALASNGHPAGRQAGRNAMTSADQAVRIAAYRTLAATGNGDDVLPLAQAAAGTTDRNESQAVREALYQIRGADVTAAIERGIRQMGGSSGSDQVAAELIRAIPERGITTANSLLFEMARHSSGRVAQEAVRSLQTTVTQNDMPAVMRLLADRPGAAVETVAIAAAEQISDHNRRARALLAGLETVESSAAKASMIRVIGRLGDSQAVGTIRRLRDSPDDIVSQAAFRAMLEWPGMDFFDEIQELAISGPEGTDKVLAFRAYIRLLAGARNKTDAQIVQDLAEAMTLTDRVQEQRLILAALGERGARSALQLAQQYLNHSDLKAEAEVAVTGIAQRLMERDPEAAANALQAVAEQTENTTLRQRIRRLVSQAESRLGHILVWQISGPYTQDNKGPEELFDVSFLPETDPEQAQWQPMSASGGRGNFWLMDLNQAIGGSDRVAYARAIIVSPQETQARFELGSDDGIKVWLNGQLVHSNNALRAVQQGEDKVDVQLRRGENEVLLKITQGGQDWGFCLRVTDLDGSPMRGLRVK